MPESITVNILTENGPVAADIRCDSVAMVMEAPGQDNVDMCMLTFEWGDSIGPIAGSREEVSALVFGDDDGEEEDNDGE